MREGSRRMLRTSHMTNILWLKVTVWSNKYYSDILNIIKIMKHNSQNIVNNHHSSYILSKLRRLIKISISIKYIYIYKKKNRT